MGRTSVRKYVARSIGLPMYMEGSFHPLNFQ